MSHSAFFWVWTGTLVSNVGTWMETTSQNWLLWEKSHSSVWTGRLWFVGLIPMALLALPMGVVADRFDRRRIFLALQVLMCAGALLQAVACHMGWTEPWMTVGIALLEGIAAGAVGPVWHSFVPSLIPREELGGAIALNSAQFNTARAVGPMLAGLVMNGFGLAFSFDINVASFALLIAALCLVKPSRPPRKAEPGALLDGVRTVRAHKGMRRLVWTGCGSAFFAAPMFALLPAIAERKLGGEAGTYSSLLSAVGTGAVAGAFLIGSISARTTRQQAIALAGILVGLALAALAVSRIWAVSAALLFVFGIGWSVLFTTQNTALQMLTPDAKRARVMSVNVFSWVAAPVASYFFGWIAQPERLDVTGTLWILGAGALAIASFQILSVVPEIEASAAWGVVASTAPAPPPPAR